MAIPLIAPLLSGAISWIFRTAIIKAVSFFILTTLMGVMIAVVFKIMALCCDISLNGFNVIWSYIPPEIWFFLDWFQIGYGFKVILGAVVTRFLISLVPFGPR